jgi:hypothetical protein
MKVQKIVFMLFLLAIACSGNDDTIPSDFSIYVRRFEDEGHARSAAFSISNLTVLFVDEATLPMYCGYGTSDPPKVQIKKSGNCWYDRSDLDKEILLFHELGHAVLSRQHINDTLPNGDFKSMMFDGNQFGIYNEYTPEKRKYYIDELFNLSVQPPDWSKVERKERISILRDTIAQTNHWVFSNNNKPQDQGATIVTADQGHALSITSATVMSGSFSSWTYEFPPSQIPPGSKLILKVQIKLNGVTGPGVYFAMRGDSGSSRNFFVTSQGTQSITGTRDFAEYSIKLNYYPNEVTRIYLFLLIDGTSTGTVYFDDVELVNYK